MCIITIGGHTAREDAAAVDAPCNVHEQMQGRLYEKAYGARARDLHVGGGQLFKLAGGIRIDGKVNCDGTVRGTNASGEGITTLIWVTPHYVIASGRR